MRMTVQYCPHCWAEVSRNSTACPQCGAGLNDDGEDYLTKLIGALNHPDYLTQRRAAFIMGWLGDGRALQPLIATLRGTADPYVRAEAANALGALEGAEAEAALSEAAGNSKESVIVRQAAQAALERRGL
jgi:HEAT repeat protein